MLKVYISIFTISDIRHCLDRWRRGLFDRDAAHSRMLTTLWGWRTDADLTPLVQQLQVDLGEGDADDLRYLMRPSWFTPAHAFGDRLASAFQERRSIRTCPTLNARRLLRACHEWGLEYEARQGRQSALLERTRVETGAFSFSLVQQLWREMLAADIAAVPNNAKKEG